MRLDELPWEDMDGGGRRADVPRPHPENEHWDAQTIMVWEHLPTYTIRVRRSEFYTHVDPITAQAILYELLESNFTIT